MGDREYSKRERKKRGVNLSALEQLKQSRSGKTRAIDRVKDEEDVYEYVTEEQYADIVNSRISHDWVVGDAKTSGYVETGREVFDDEYVEEEFSEGVSNPRNKRKKPKHVQAPTDGGITQFLMKNKSKAQKETKSLGTDHLVDELLSTLGSPNISSDSLSDTKPKPRTLMKPTMSVTPKAQDRPAPTKLLPKSTKNELDGFLEEMLPENPVIQPDEDSMDIAMNEVDDFDLPLEPENKENISADQIRSIKPQVKVEPKTTVPSSWSMSTPFVDELSTAEETKTDVPFDKSSTPTIEQDGETLFRMYCLDVYENPYNNPGVVYLLGKVQVSGSKYTSAAVAIRNIPRTVFLLPRTRHPDTGGEVRMLDVYNEFNDVIAPRFRINKFQSKPSERKFAWSSRPEVPFESEYLEVRYSAEFQALPHDLSGKTFSRVFSTTESALEHFVLRTRLKGPSWVTIRNFTLPRQQHTWCTYEVVTEKMSDVTVDREDGSVPALTVVSLSMKTVLNTRSNVNEVVCVGGLIHSGFHVDKAAPGNLYERHFSGICCTASHVLPYDFEKVKSQSKTNIEVFMSERSLLGWLVARLQKIDPDVIVGYDSVFDIEVLLHRLAAVRVPHWSRLSRFKRNTLPKGFGSTGLVGVGVMAGRLVADSKISCKELVRLRKYDMGEFAKVILRQTRDEFNQDRAGVIFDSSTNIMYTIHHTLNDASINLKVMFELMALPLSHQITKLCGNVWQRTLLGGRAERNEYLLLHAFHEQDFIVPDKKTLRMKATEEAEESGETGKKKNSYAGGLVLEPKKGFYDTYILLLDFNSLYPSIIQEYNICFTTVDGSTAVDGGTAEVPPSDLPPGILPTEIRKLVERRKEVKNLLKGETPGSDKYLQYDIRQKALKLTANSMYGCLGFTNSRFYAKQLAALVTAKGREALLSAKDLVEANMRLEVVYGDTDSIMINTHSVDITEVMQLGRRVKAEVNKMYRLLEIDIDGVFKSMLLLKKKKYAAISLHVKPDGGFREEKEMKGLDIVRRDWCDLAKDAGSTVLDFILANKSRDEVLEEIHSYLTDIGKKVAADEVPVQKYIIQKSLTKAPKDYPDKKAQPHVQVALRLISQGRRVVSGDVVEYVICEDGNSGAAPTQRAYHPSELAAQPGKLSLDKHYYLSSQLHPVVSRLVSPIEGTDGALIAECLGLDPAPYAKLAENSERNSTDMLSLSEQERFKDCIPFNFGCHHCGSAMSLRSLASGNPLSSSFECSSCKKHQSGHYISNKLILAAKHCIGKYYEGIVKCDDQACAYTSRRTTPNNRCSQCHKGNLRYTITEATLNTQLSFYLSLVDYKKFALKQGRTKVAPITYLQDTLTVPYRTMSKLLERNGFSQIDLTNLFNVLGS